jgi:hypothetical protein
MTLNDLITVLQTTYVPVHPGLAKYLTDKGIWNAGYEKRNQTNTALFRQYMNGYQDAMTKGAALNIDIKANNDKWIEYWENYKLSNKIPLIEMHVSLTQDAPIVMPPGYIAATTVPATTVPATTTPPTTSAAPTSTPASTDIPFTLVSILNDAGNAPHPGDNVAVIGKTTPGASVKILFTYTLSGVATPSAYPPAPDNTQTAGADGIVKYTWNINNHIPAGAVIYTFTITLNGQKARDFGPGHFVYRPFEAPRSSMPRTRGQAGDAGDYRAGYPGHESDWKDIENQDIRKWFYRPYLNKLPVQEKSDGPAQGRGSREDEKELQPPAGFSEGRGYHEESAQYPERGQVIPEVAAPSQPGVERKHEYYARQQDPEKYPR